ncbi:hypothetical protein BJ138DRAFT_513229 [Hygrophoropsis aurantiaca]|uniref:Uncharacterized protein n=1 Tax=Hygrophoropsis aurantiaca TaxID=72124 RepID=A0ACB8A2Q5_9AGAM|nr:hypothetical protein BJ138DRAFT_513229 [Hygrophoropsis aurantiaca]
MKPARHHQPDHIARSKLTSLIPHLSVHQYHHTHTMTRDHTNDHDTNIRAALKTIEDEVLELKKQEFDLITQLRLLRDTIGRKCMLARKLKNSLVPVNRLPDEILLACFGKAVQEWMDKNNGADERVFARSRWSYTPKDFRLPRTPVFAISHVSQRWRQLAITAPSLWTNLIITPKFQRHSDVFREFLYRANGMPIALNFRFLFRLEGTLSSDAVLTHAQQIKSITFLASGPVLSYLLSQAVEQTITGPTNPSSITFNCLTELSIFGLHYSDGLTFSRLRQLLSATPHLETLELQHDVTLNHEERVDEERADRAEISLPKLENLTIINSSLLAFKFLDSLSAPSVHQLKLLVWDPGVSFDATSCLFIPDSDNDDDNLGLPKFPSVQKLTLSCSYDFEVLDADLISAFVQITHLT